MKRYLAVVLVGLFAANLVASLPAHAATRKHKKPAACAPYAAGDFAKDAPAVKVTDAATADKPLEQKVTLDQSTADVPEAGGDPTIAYFNVQVDSAAATAGLYAHIDFPQRNDYDLEFQYPDESFAARSHAWNTIIEANDQTVPGINYTPSSTGHGGHSTATSEELVGIDTPDCGGYSVKVTNWLSQGGDVTVKLWLGEIKNEPEAPGEEPPA